MSSLNNVLNMFHSQESLNSYRTYGNSIKEICKSDSNFFNKIVNIASSNNRSIESWYKYSGECLNEAITLGVIMDDKMITRSKKIESLKLLSSNKNHSKEALELCNMYALEGFKENISKMMDVIAEIFKRLFESLVAAGKMIANFIGSQIAKIHTSFYEKHKAEIISALKINGSKRVKYVKFNSSKDPADLINTFNKEASVNEVKEALNLMKSENNVNVSKIKIIFGNYDDVEAYRKAKNELLNETFYDADKKPESVEHAINDLLSEKTLSALSADYLNKLKAMHETGKKYEKQLAELVKFVKDYTKKAISTLKKDKENDNSQAIENYKTIQKSLNIVKSITIVDVSTIRQAYGEALSYRSTIYRLAKSVLAKDKDKKESK